MDRETLDLSIDMGILSGETVKKHLPFPHDLEYEKTFYPFMILKKKKYVGNKYEEDENKCKLSYMGIVLKRRDNANIVKKVLGGLVNIMMYENDVDKAINYVLLKVAKGIGSAVGAGLTGSFTLLDQMAYILRKGIDLSKNLSTLVLSLLRKIAELLGMRKTIEAADATMIFIRNLFQRLHQKVSEQAQKILDAVLVKGRSI